MKRMITVAFAATILVSSGGAYADMLELAKQKECLTCHDIDHGLTKAPSFKAIARKYNADLAPMLERRVLVGGVGHWGAADMPNQGARVEVNEEEAKALVTWILGMR